MTDKRVYINYKTGPIIREKKINYTQETKAEFGNWQAEMKKKKIKLSASSQAWQGNRKRLLLFLSHVVKRWILQYISKESDNIEIYRQIDFDSVISLV